MRSIKAALGGVLLLASLGMAGPAKKVAMVLEVRGVVTSQSKPVVTGQLWTAGDSIELAQGAQVTVLLLNQGERREISGKGSLEVAADGLSLRGGGAIRTVASSKLQMPLTGENHRQIAGMVLRNSAIDVKNSPFDEIEVDPQGVKVSRPAEEGGPPALRFYFLAKYDNPILNSDLQRVRMPGFPKPTETLSVVDAEGQQLKGRWAWRVSWPSEAGQAQALDVREPSLDQRQLYIRVHQSAPQELAELKAAREEVARWAEQEPGVVGPFVYLANLLEEMGQQEAALETLKSALELKPEDEGLVHMQARLLLDLGQYADAAKALGAQRQ